MEEDGTTGEEYLAMCVTLAVMGRFFMPNNFRDRWELFVFCYGESSVGKGALVNLLKSLLEPELIGELSGSSRKGLGSLQSFVFKVFLFVVEAERLDKLISLGDFKAMASSEELSVSQLCKGSNRDIRWNKQLWMSGQEATALFPSDPSGAAMRRTLAAWFRRKHTHSSYSVEQGLIKERFQFFAVAVKMYHYLLAELEGVKLLEWPKLPAYFQLGKDKVTEQLSAGERFFSHTTCRANETRGRRTMCVMAAAGALGLSDLKLDLEEFCETGPERNTNCRFIWVCLHFLLTFARSDKR